MNNDGLLSQDELDALAQYDTPTICNALELVVPERRGFGYTCDSLHCGFPEMKPMVGYARTLTIRSTEPSSLSGAESKALRASYYEYFEAGPRPSIAVVQDLDGDRAGYGSFWGEVNSAIHKGLGGLGVITDGCIRDVDTWAPGFQFLSRRICPSHAFVHVVGYGGDVNVLGMRVSSGDLVHADRHGAVVIPHAVARRIHDACDLLNRREAVILKVARAPDVTAAKLKQAMAEMDEIH